MSAPGAEPGSTLHLVFSAAGLREALPYVRAGDRVLRMHGASRIGDPLPVPAPVFNLRAPGDAGDDADGSRIDEPTMVRWCVEAARVISWP